MFYQLQVFKYLSVVIRPVTACARVIRNGAEGTAVIAEKMGEAYGGQEAQEPRAGSQPAGAPALPRPGC